jgi:hypothetical protein
MDPVADNLKFNLDTWPDGVLTRDFALPPSVFHPYLEQEAASSGAAQNVAPELLTSLRGRLELRLMGSRLFVKGVFAVKVEMSCARCLSTFTGRLGDQIDEVVEIGAPEEASGAEDPDFFVPVKNREIDLAPLLAELFWLSWPLKPLCRPDCLGLCPRCGADLNAGPCGCSEAEETRH